MLDPIAFSLGPLQVRWYGILLAVGFLLGYYILRYLAKEKNLSEQVVDDFYLYLIPLAIVGARLVTVFIYEPAFYLSNPLEILFIWKGGVSVHGGFIGAFLAVYLVTKKHKLHFYELADLLPIPFFLGAALGRIGNFINQELVGKPSSLPWALAFDEYEQLRHPSQIYESLKNFTLMAITWNLRKLGWKRGMMFWASLGLYSLFRFAVEFWKDLPQYISLTIAQWISWPLIILSMYMFYRIKR